MSIFSWVKSLFVTEPPKPKKEKPIRYVWENPQLKKKRKRPERFLKNINKRFHYKVKNQNPGVKKFMKQELVFDPEWKTTYFDLFNTYVKWCVNNHTDFLTYNGFFQALNYLTRNKTVYKWDKKIKGGMRERVFCGIGFRKYHDDQLELGI